MPETISLPQLRPDMEAALDSGFARNAGGSWTPNIQ